MEGGREVLTEEEDGAVAKLLPHPAAERCDNNVCDGRDANQGPREGGGDLRRERGREGGREEGREVQEGKRISVLRHEEGNGKGRE
jgi:hypothetical protein